jgi:hypothetical protein
MRLCVIPMAISMCIALLSPVSHAAPVVEPWSFDATGGGTSVSAAELSGWYATASTHDDRIEIRDIRQKLIAEIARNDLLVHASWMSLDSSDDGPRALAWTDSGRSLFIVVTDDSPSTDGLGSDVVLRYDTTTRVLTRFTRANIGDGTGQGPAAMHYKGKLWISTDAGSVRVYDAFRNDTGGFLQYTWSLPNAQPVRGFGLARSLDLAFVVSESMLYRVDLTQPFAIAEPVGEVASGEGVMYSDHFGAPAQEGVYVLDENRVRFVPRFQATGLLAYSPIDYLQSDGPTYHDLSSTPCGGMLIGADAAVLLVRDDADARLDYESWLQDEFDQVVQFASGLVAPDGEPAGWVTDADVALGGTRFHPASPDGAGWVLMLHVAKDHLADDQASVGLVRDILMRYAGMMPDGIAPRVTQDGIMHHWYDPWTGNSAPGWDPEYATLSTMLIVMGADRARRFYANDPLIVQAASTIIGRVNSWDRFIQPGSNAIYFKAVASGGPDFGSASGAFNEGVMFIDQASSYDAGSAALAYWLDRSALPSAAYVDALPVTTNWPGGHLPAFVSLYPWIAQESLRSEPEWETHMRNLLASNGAWTDDNAPRFMTVFSAGTTRPEWGGYNADSLSDHPGDIATFPSLMGFGSLGETAPSVGAYHAYRHNARQAFATGASLLFRRSEVIPGYTPNDAGLSDVVIGALGLAELLKPGTTDAVLAVSYQQDCLADFALPRGQLDFFDVSAFLGAYLAEESAADLARPFGRFDFFDVSAYLGAYGAGCP